MINLVEREECTSCMACYNACPKSAVKIIRDKKGFYYPEIDNDLCIECGSCIQVCPMLGVYEHSNKNKYKQKYIACWNKDKFVRKQSSSGGIFSLLSKIIIKGGGVVYGVAFDADYMPIFTRIETEDNISLLRGSKYVQSNVGDAYRNVKKDLKIGKKVLFAGSPCQIAGLKKYLQKEYNSLLLVDIICHGVPSPEVWKRYLQDISGDNYSSKIKAISFRDKSISWFNFCMRIEFSDRTNYLVSKEYDPYLLAFLNDYITKDRCHRCPYTSFEREGDVTIADFWQYSSDTKKMRNTEDGISLFIVNNEKGEKIFHLIEEDVSYVFKTKKEALISNQCLQTPYKKNEKSAEFWDRFFKGESVKEIMMDFYPNGNRPSFLYKLHKFYWDNKYRIPNVIIKMLDQIYSIWENSKK